MFYNLKYIVVEAKFDNTCGRFAEKKLELSCTSKYENIHNNHY